MEIAELIQSVKQLIADDKIKGAIDLLLLKKELSPISLTKLEVFQNRLQALNKKKILGTITTEELKVERTKIVESLLTGLNQKQAASHYSSKKKTHKYFSITAIIILLFLAGWGAYNFFGKSIAKAEGNENSFDILTLPFTNQTAMDIEKNLEDRFYDYGNNNDFLISCFRGIESKNRGVSYNEIKEIGLKSNADLVIFGSAYPLPDNVDSTYINLRYQSLLIDSFHNNLDNSHFHIKYEYDILSGKITGGVEEAIDKTIELIGFQRVLMKGKDAAVEPLIDELTTKLKANENDPFYLSLKASLHLYKNNIEKALDDYQKVLSIDSTNTNALNNIAVIMLDKGAEDEAFKYFERAQRYDNGLSANLTNNIFRFLAGIEADKLQTMRPVKDTSTTIARIFPTRPDSLVKRKSETSKSEVPIHSGVYYKIQIAVVLTFDPNQAMFSEVKTIGPLETEYISEKGWYRVMLADFVSINEARNAMLKAQQAGFINAFLVKYRNGRRITP